MIRRMLNLRCDAGHLFYSPMPRVWSGRDCLQPLDDLGRHRCHASLHALRKPLTPQEIPADDSRPPAPRIYRQRAVKGSES